MKILLLVAVCMMTLWAAPQWYYKLPKHNNSYCIGYGQGPNEHSAKEAALSDIARQIAVTVDNRRSHALSEDEGSFSESFHDESTQTSHVKIFGYDMLRQDREGDRYFVAIGYENIPGVEKFNRMLAENGIKGPQKQNHYLMHTAIAAELDEKVDFALKRRDHLWNIRYHGLLQPLDMKEFAAFFTTVRNPHIDLQISKHNETLYEGEEFYFDITASRDGYLTLFTVYEDGTVATLVRNIYIKKDRKESIPDTEFEIALQAGLIQKGVETYDLYVAVLTSEKKPFDRFAKADEELIDDERYKNFDALITTLDEAEFATLKVVTKPR